MSAVLFGLKCRDIFSKGDFYCFVSGVYHHKQLYHHRGREGQEEAGSRSQASLMWNGDPGNQYMARRNYADGAGASTLEGMGYRCACLLDQQLNVCFYGFR